MAKLISELQEHDRLTFPLLVGNIVKGTSNNGLVYLTIDFKDCSGTIQGKKWDVTPYDESIIKTGEIVDVSFEVISYKGALQLKVLKVDEILNRDLIDMSRFIKQPPVKKEELIEKLNYYISLIKNEDCLAILKYIQEKVGDKLYVYPAAQSIHHEYSSGLLYHTVSMCSMAEYICSYYKDVDKDLLLTGTILHDFGKTEEFEGDLVYTYSTEGKLVGHISIIDSLIREAKDALNITSEVPMLLEHMVLSHHGQLEFGSPVLPSTKEALILSLIDNMDSKIALVSKVLENVKEGEFSSKVMALDGRMIYKPKK